MNEEDWIELLREAHREEIPEAHYAAVRARVLAELGRERKPFWRWAWVLGLAAAAVAVTVMIIPRPAPVGQTGVPTASVGPPAVVAEATAPVYGPAAPPQVVRVAHHRRTLRPEGRPGGPPHSEPVVIKLLTDDPNVVIYWIGE